jgi:hypothetical protein
MVSIFILTFPHLAASSRELQFLRMVQNAPFMMIRYAAAESN